MCLIWLWHNRASCQEMRHSMIEQFLSMAYFSSTVLLLSLDLAFMGGGGGGGGGGGQEMPPTSPLAVAYYICMYSLNYLWLKISIPSQLPPYFPAAYNSIIHSFTMQQGIGLAGPLSLPKLRCRDVCTQYW